MSDNFALHGTTILCLKKKEEIIIAADGQVSHGNTVLKSTARKLRTIANNKIIVGFAGSTADGLALFEKLEIKIEQYNSNLLRSAVELAKDWRNDKYLRRLEAMMIVADRSHILILTGNGDVIEPENNVAAIGSGGLFALSAARALMSYENNLTAEEIALKSMNIAADLCVFSNHNIIMEKVV
ncbi:ATP-dependent protease subunit HslV [Rickettsia prowazekii]|uniref:ATP-dependent protease subunit HslV n=2 Tax=Rickettsia prowazekii TaxID=782 RepID=HSLV_RICPR|nr:ATP-dependent protease subunit HslV [Rickettsia prowazekii]Q9ZDK9.1 RecName: Full=ATP-dependent protease subunit HslV [Rickettsia prowazekii str. Madrid E]EOB09678.1 ATP-dependent protease subunit HslV [Rickettsia prowazekii str. GvF12]ADE29835.1 Heat shock protein HslV [Rickettsia prowazekii str. Rp22]AFE49136.1 ATP-dependent protease subunit HslV [Rickettsia prowazekii str. Chernikova]AFE49982.1 ATP-dependent protease subunit HslV [Rickettsia prowazekii str. Katsinyian]AFE50826.1 ATP-dep